MDVKEEKKAKTVKLIIVMDEETIELDGDSGIFYLTNEGSDVAYCGIAGTFSLDKLHHAGEIIPKILAEGVVKIMSDILTREHNTE